MEKILNLPEIAESVVEGEILKWFKREGEFVEKNEPLVEIETQKVTVEIPSPYRGILKKILAKEGDVVEVHKPIAVFEVDEKEEVIKEEKKEEIRLEEVSQKIESKALFRDRKIFATPAARKWARELGLSLNQIKVNKRVITKKDVIEFKQRAEKKYISEEKERIVLRGIRKEIAKKLRESKDKAVHTLHVDEADLTELVELRNKIKKIGEEKGIKITFLPFIMKASVLALKKHPYLNSTYDEAKEEIVIHNTYNFGIAVATESGLIVPVIKNVEKKNLLQLAEELIDKSEKARKGNLSIDDVEGGTFTITNIGSIGGLFSFPIINYPQTAILGIHSIKKRPVVREDEIVIRDMVYLSLSFDHRIIDGAQAAAFTKTLIEYLETPEKILLESI